MKAKPDNFPERSSTAFRVILGIVIGAVILLVLLTRTRGEQVTPVDDMIERAVKDQLHSSEAVDAYRIEVESADGIVTLSGRIDNLLASRHAARAAQRIKGVLAVSNQLVIEPAPRPDEEINADVTKALMRSMGRDPMLKVTVNRGVVSLSGEVESPGERFLALDAASSVAGVRGVESSLEVERTGELSDTGLQTQIQSLIEATAGFADSGISVGVRDKAATIRGTVGSDAARSLLAEKAKLCGAKAVDVSGVNIDWSKRNEKVRKDKLDEMDFKKVVDNVQLALRHNPWVGAQASKIRVAAGDDYVLLDGIVDSGRAKSAAVKAARNTVGVYSVRDEMRVSWDGESPPSDIEITQDVAEAVNRDAYLRDQEIIVRTRNGHVRLYGLVDTNFVKRRALQIADAQPGVVHVANYLTVLKEWEPVSDTKLEKRIREKFKWMLFEPSAKVRVNVKDGVALLSGVVSNWRQWQLAMDLAIEAGARRPHNMIEIHGASTLHHRSDEIYVPE